MYVCNTIRIGRQAFTGPFPHLGFFDGRPVFLLRVKNSILKFLTTKV